MFAPLHHSLSRGRKRHAASAWHGTTLAAVARMQPPIERLSLRRTLVVAWAFLGALTLGACSAPQLVYNNADTLLRFNPKRAAVMVRKTLRAAIADAEQNEVPIDRLYVSESRVDEGMIIKRFRPKDRGRAHPIQKKTSHIVVGVEELD